VIIFGWGGSKFMDHGAVWMQTCPNCHNSGWFHYVTTHASFRLFFVPIVPYDRKHYLMCPVCNRGPQLDDAGVETAKQAMLLLARTRMGELSENEYSAELERLLNQQVAGLPAGAARIESSAEEAGSTPSDTDR
jgi:hypothetical protein